MTKRTLYAPLIHSNGTSKKELQEAIANAAREIRKASEALRETLPHGRDYYPLRDNLAYNKARAQYIAQSTALQNIYDELVAIFNAIENGETTCQVETTIEVGG